MEVLSIIRNVAMSPKKVRHVTRQIVGLPVLAAKNALDAMPRKSSHWVAKTLQSAIANAENNNQLNPESLRVHVGRLFHQLRRHGAEWQNGCTRPRNRGG